MTHRDFDAEDAARLAQYGLPTFTLSGETFTLRDDVPLDVLVLWDDFNRPAAPDSEGNVQERSQAERVRMIMEVWHNLLIPEDGSRFDTLMTGPRKPGVIHLIKAAEWAVETITGRPFDQSSDSPTPSAEETPQAGSTAPALRVAGVASAGTGSGTPPT